MDKVHQKPSVVIVSSSSTKPKSLIKLITGATNVFEDEDANKIWYPWKIDTKYYSANINIYGITEEFVRTEEFNDNVQALLIHMDSNKQSGLEELDKWATIEDDCDPEIKLLISNYCTNETKITKTKATEWCLKRGFELIELYPNVSQSNSDTDDCEIIEEKTGVSRVIEALQTHIWPNLIMKNKVKMGTSLLLEEDKDALEKNVLTSGSVEIDNSLLNNFLTDEGTDDFTELFSQLNMVKESMKSMPASQRKQCAEQMVTAFWEAMGGDEEEILDA